MAYHNALLQTRWLPLLDTDLSTSGTTISPKTPAFFFGEPKNQPTTPGIPLGEAKVYWIDVSLKKIQRVRTTGV